MAGGPTVLKGPVLLISRAGWLVVSMVVMILWYVNLTEWTGLPPMSEVGFAVLMPLGYIATAAVLIWRGGQRTMTIITGFTLSTLGPYMISGVNGIVAEQTLPLAVLNACLVIISYTSVTLFLFVFPNGRLEPAWTRFIVLILCLFVVPAAAYDVWLGRTSLVSLTMLMVSFVVGGVLVQWYRYAKVYSETERQQTKWVIGGLTMTLAAILWWFITFELLGWESLTQGAAAFISAGLTLLLPVSIAISITRYRLWDLGIVIQRTLVYGLITAILALVYFGGVVVTQVAFRAITGQESQLAVVVSTLAIAALFTPLRNRVQEFVDRRFYRQKYDAERTLEAFSQAMRDEVDLDELTSELIKAVQTTMQPEKIMLWVHSEETMS